jgi:hypothetical protein
VLIYVKLYVTLLEVIKNKEVTEDLVNDNTPEGK